MRGVWIAVAALGGTGAVLGLGYIMLGRRVSSELAGGIAVPGLALSSATEVPKKGAAAGAMGKLTSMKNTAQSKMQAAFGGAMAALPAAIPAGVAGAGLGATVGGTVGTGIGAGLGALGFGFGAAVGAPIGGAIGTGVGAVGGAAAAGGTILGVGALQGLMRK